MQSHDAVGVGHISDVPPRCILRVQSSVLRLLPLFLVAQSLGKASLFRSRLFRPNAGVDNPRSLCDRTDED